MRRRKIFAPDSRLPFTTTATARLSCAMRTALVGVGSRASSQFHTVGLNPPTPSTFRSSSSYSSASSSPAADGSSGGGGDDYSQSADEAALQAASTQLLRFKIDRREQFYFMSAVPSTSGSSSCRLCGEFVPEKQVKFHLSGAGVRGPSSHMGREILLDTLIFYARAGFDPALVPRSWPHTLLSCAHFSRLPSLLPQQGRGDPTDLDARAEQVVALLRGLQAMGVLDVAVSPHSDVARTVEEQRNAVKRRGAFERFETIGDNSWGSNLSGRLLLLFPDKRWSNCNMHHSFNAARDLAETNSNLERIFDVLQLQSLLPPASRAAVGDGKIKADIVEAVVGELNAAIYVHESTLLSSEEFTELNSEHLHRLLAVIRHVHSEIFDLTILFMLQSLCEHSVPLVRELVQVPLFFPAPTGSVLGSHHSASSSSILTSSGVTPSALVTAIRPPLDPGESVRTRRPTFNANFVPSFILPQRQALSKERGGNDAVDSALFALLHRTGYSERATELAKFPLLHRRQRELGGPVAVNGIRPQYLVRPRWEPFGDIMQGGGEEEEEIFYPLSPVPHQRSTRAPSREGEEIESQPPLTSERPSSASSEEETDGHDSSARGLSGGGVNSSSSNISRRFSAASLLSHNSNKFRSSCPFRQLSFFPPHSYNPYGLSSEAWMAQWTEKEREVREIFGDDFDIDVVLAQYEATSRTTSSVLGSGSAKKSKSTAAAIDADSVEPDWSEELQASRSTAVGYSNLVDVAVRYIGQQKRDDRWWDAGELEDTPDICHVALAQQELLEAVHPFQDGVTVGSDGASFLALSSSIASVPLDRFQIFSSSAPAASTPSDAAAIGQDDKADEAGGGASSSASLDGIDIDSIKRRNMALRGEKVK